MQNSTLSTLSYFILGAYFDVGDVKYVYFTATALLYATILAVNASLIAAICVNRSLHEPMYLFLCNLFVNELYGSTALFPFLLVQILSDVHTVSASACFLQIFCIYTYASVEFCNLAVMSYDRYFAICCPLQYNAHMTSKKVLLFILAMWLFSFVKVSINISLSMRLQLCGNVVNNLYCHNFLVVKLACSDTRAHNVYGLFTTVLTVIVPLVPIFFSYVRIFQVCFSARGSRQTREKALSTCTPHLASLLNFSFGCCFEVVQSRFDMSGVPPTARILLSLYFLLIQPLMNPVMYGLQMSKIRKTFLFCYKTLTHHSETPQK